MAGVEAAICSSRSGFSEATAGGPSWHGGCESRGSLEASMSQALTEVSHLSAFTTSSRTLSVRLSRSGSQVPTPRIAEGWPSDSSNQAPSSASSGRTLGSGSTSGVSRATVSTESGSSRRPPRVSAARLALRRSTSLGCSVTSSNTGASSSGTEAASSSGAESSGGFTRRCNGRPLSASRLSRSSSKDREFEDFLDVQSFADSSFGVASTLAATSKSTLSNVTMPDTSDGAPSPDGATGADQRRSPGTWSRSSSARSSAAQASATAASSVDRSMDRPCEQDLLDLLVRHGTFDFSDNTQQPSTPKSASRRRRDGAEAPSEDLGWRGDACFASSQRSRQSPRGQCMPAWATVGAAPPPPPLAAPTPSLGHGSGREEVLPARSKGHSQPPIDALDLEVMRSSETPLRSARCCSPNPTGRATTPSGGSRPALGRSSTLRGTGRVICSTLT
mmetsp:Transcript_44339/g.137573  ORF Transcript_44339/g.137573 Transcript_44339/m.137573 type:complete len:447 (-) Transcript_44339:81-1421(-)